MRSFPLSKLKIDHFRLFRAPLRQVIQNFAKAQYGYFDRDFASIEKVICMRDRRGNDFFDIDLVWHQ